ncbi:radical SAM protein [Corallococcus exercitus]|uniref:radical SAM protein n=1 Tax=Corallococcus exercitus TaxID=2316736 RepID=UPI0035D43B0A
MPLPPEAGPVAPGAPAEARALFAASRPRARDLHLLSGEDGHALLLVDGSRLFDVDAESFQALDAAAEAGDDAAVRRLLEALGVDAPPFVGDEPLASAEVTAVSLAVAQKCNLGCTYCYAREGDFGGPARNMPLEVALRSVDLLLEGKAPGSRANLAFLGGEPLANRSVLRAATRHAAERARAREVRLTFSLTTNGTLLTPEDAEFFEEHGFAVTVSLDGPREAHDRLRPFKGGRGSYDAVMAAVAPLLSLQRRMQVSARVTVTPRNLQLRESLDEMVALGFHSVGFSPMLRSPTGRDEMQGADLEAMLEQMVSCGREFERRIVAGERYPFANMVNALRELHKGTHRPYPCGAGAGYVGISAEGELAACHRFVGDKEGQLGHVDTGVDASRQGQWLSARHVHAQRPCDRCWARYLCGGGCHHEVIHRGRPACDYIRGWLHYSLGAYLRLSRARPDWFGIAARD